MQRGEIFQNVRVKRPKFTAFDLSFENKLSTNFGVLTPFACVETIPGDTFKMQADSFVRFAPMLAPVFHRIDVYNHFFYVPNRLIWAKWKKFITGGKDGTEEPVKPSFSYHSVGAAIAQFAKTFVTDLYSNDVLADASTWDTFRSYLYTVIAITPDDDDADRPSHAITLYIDDLCYFLLDRLRTDGFTSKTNVAAGRIYRYLYERYLGLGSLADYFGVPSDMIELPTDNSNGATVDSAVSLLSQEAIDLFPFIAYQLVYNEYYRDQNLTFAIPYLGSDDTEERLGWQGDIFTITASSNGIITPWIFGLMLLDIHVRAWEKDYFTSALPWAQRGPQATLPLAEGSVDFEGTGDFEGHFELTPNQGEIGISDEQAGAGSDGYVYANNGKLSVLHTDGITKYDATSLNGHAIGSGVSVTGTLDLSTVTAVTVNTLRHAIALQRWLETNARGGARYIEQLLGHFGVISSDATLQRPQYLSGGKSPVVVSEVTQTSDASANETPLGEMAGHAISSGASRLFTYTAEEHGFIIAIMSVRPRSAYQNGLSRMFTRFDKFDYAWPELAHLGEQEVANKEIYFDPRHAVDVTSNATFGYQSRFAEYKFVADQVHGDFKKSLDYWHLGRRFSELPQLSGRFVQVTSEDDLNRIFADTNKYDQHLWCQIYTMCHVVRALPAYGTPGII